MKRVFWIFLFLGTFLMVHTSAYADQTVTVTATNADISENLDLRTVATLFGQAKDLEEFEQLLNQPDSAFSNLDLNGDGDVDYLRVVETADGTRHLVVIQAVLAQDIYQDVASIFVEKDPESESVTVQVIGDEYIYGADYIIEPVYIYRPYIYDWFWGPSWVCWHSPYYWGYWPSWWHPYHCLAHHLYWDHMYWYHHYHPYCSYRTAHHFHPHYAPMRERVSRADYAVRHPERSFATRNASMRVSNARAFDSRRQATVRQAARTEMAVGRGGQTRLSEQSTSRRNSTFGSTNVRTRGAGATAVRGTDATTRGGASVTRGSSVARDNNKVSGATRTATRTVSSTPTRSGSSATQVTRTGSATRSVGTTTTTSPSRSSSTTTTRSTSATRSTGTSTMRSSSSAGMRSSGMSAGGGGMRSAGGASRSGGSTRR